jgi:hypothetical protein
MSTNRPSGFRCRLESPCTSGLRVEIKSGLAPTDVLRQMRAASRHAGRGKNTLKTQQYLVNYTPEIAKIQRLRQAVAQGRPRLTHGLLTLIWGDGVTTI